MATPPIMYICMVSLIPRPIQNSNRLENKVMEGMDSMDKGCNSPDSSKWKC